MRGCRLCPRFGPKTPLSVAAIYMLVSIYLVTKKDLAVYNSPFVVKKVFENSSVCRVVMSFRVVSVSYSLQNEGASGDSRTGSLCARAMLKRDPFW